MENVNPENFLLVEKYRPRKIDDCILPQRMKDMAKGYVSSGRIPSLILAGTAGTGKTTLAKAMCNEVGADWLMINASSESGIDTFRNKITQFASTSSFSDAKKVIILDEADSLQLGSTQPALRSGMEAFSENCTFILTCNYPNRIMDPIHSRCGMIQFSFEKDEIPILQLGFFKRLKIILDAENIQYDKKVIVELIKKLFPDFRKVLNTIQQHAASGPIDSSVLLDHGESSFNELVEHLKSKKFVSMRQWVANHSDMTPNDIVMMFAKHLDDKMVQKSIPDFILMLGEYNKTVGGAANPDISLLAFLTETMRSGLEWK